MNIKKLWITALISLGLLVVNYQWALAHETITVGDYEIEVGWLNEPPVAGLQNAVVVTITNTSGAAVEDVSSLTVTVSYGGQSKPLTLEPLGEDTPGEFMALLLPTLPGEYEVEFGGSLDDTAVDAHTHVEEVQPADTVQFPVVESTQSSMGNNWLVWLSLFVGLIGAGLGMAALRKSR